MNCRRQSVKVQSTLVSLFKVERYWKTNADGKWDTDSTKTKLEIK